MIGRQRVVENLNRALGAALDEDPRLFLLGEDILDPYGGAFRATRGLSTRFADRVIATPISEAGAVGVACGLALAGNAAIVEIMFSDFVTLAFDQIVNVAAKTAGMYGHPVPMRLVVRCPTGGGRGYGPTHSQSLQKHFLGVPGLQVFEMSPLHDNHRVLAAMLRSGAPALFFEDKRLYGSWMCDGGVVNGLFRFELLGAPPGTARVHLDEGPTDGCVLIAPGGLVGRAVEAMSVLLLEHEVTCQLLVPSRLYPVDLAPMGPILAGARGVLVVEESTPGGTWGAEVAAAAQRDLREVLRRPVRLVHSRDSAIPAAMHLEREVLVQAGTIVAAVLEAIDD